MNNLSSFLHILRQKINKGEIQRQKIADTVSFCVGIKIQTNTISVRGAVAHIRGTGALKQEILQNKVCILENFKKEGILLEDIL